MSKKDEALKLALEALENLPEMCGIEEAITAVQEALAEKPAQQQDIKFNEGLHQEREARLAAQQHEPVAWTATRLWNRKDTWTCPADIEKDLLDGCAPPAQQPEGMAEFLVDLQRSRTKYPKNGRMFDGLMGEVDELRRAYAGDGDMRAEAFDVAVCAFRIATEGDAGGNTTLEPAQQQGQREHETSEHCWCHPTLDYKDPDTGNEVWVHNEPH